MAEATTPAIPTLAQMTQKQINDYLFGRVDLPAFCYDTNHRQYPYVYSGSKTITNGQTAELDIQIDPDAYFLVEGIEIVPSVSGVYDNALVQIQDSTTLRPWSSDLVTLRDIAGRGDTPKYLSDPKIVFPSATLQTFITNNYASSVTFYVAFHGRKIYGVTDAEAAFLRRRQWYQYVFILPPMLAGSVNQTSTLQIYNEADFLLKKMYSSTIIQFVVNDSSAGSESSEIMMQLKDTSSDQNFFSQQLAARLVVGSQYSAYASGGASFTNGQGFFLKKPIFLRKTATVLGTFANRSATDTHGVQLRMAFEGCSIYPS